MTSNTKIWFITGISRGFGRELASAALEHGDVVIGTSRNGKSDIGAVPDRFHVFALDVTNHRDVASVVTQAWQISRRIDVVVNNAGFGVLGAVEEVEEQQARNVFETNFFGLLSVTQAALPHLRTQARGHIINISSVGGFVGSPGYDNASKFAVEGLSEALASELKPLGTMSRLSNLATFAPISCLAVRFNERVASSRRTLRPVEKLEREPMSTMVSNQVILPWPPKRSLQSAGTESASAAYSRRRRSRTGSRQARPS